MNAQEIANAIKALPVTHSNLKTVIGAVETYANDCKEGLDTTDVCLDLLNAWLGMDSVYAWNREQAA